MKKLLALVILSISIGCSNPAAPVELERPKTLKECHNLNDTLYVLDQHYYGDGVELYPPCSLSPEYDRCIDTRYKKITGGF